MSVQIEKYWSNLKRLFTSPEKSDNEKEIEATTVRESRYQMSLPACANLQHQVQNHPHGWPRIAAFLDSDPNFMIYRRFGYVRTRLLTYHQDVIREMEANLEKLDWDDYNNKAVGRAMCWRAGDDMREPSRRKGLFETLTEHLRTYGR
jgi:hypothetical protein